MILYNGIKYRADVTLNFVQRLASNERVAEEFEKIGFIDITVTGDGKNRKATGTWNGAMQEAPIDKRINNLQTI